jgi:hypothetical protein
VREWYGAGIHVIEGAFEEHTESCLIARCYRDALPMLLGRLFAGEVRGEGGQVAVALRRPRFE